MENEFKKIGCFVQSAFDKLKKSGDTVDGISGIPSGFKDLDKIIFQVFVQILEIWIK